MRAWADEDEEAMARASGERERDLRGMGVEPRERMNRAWSRGNYDAVELDDAGWLRARYWDDNRTLREIGSELGCSAWAVGKAMTRHGISRRPRGPRK